MLWSPTHGQSQSLLRIIALAMEQRIPLAPLLRAFAEDQSGVQRWRIHRVAGLLEGGTSLPAALEQVAGVLPAENVLAIRFGTQSGTLPITLRNLIEETGNLQEFRTFQPLNTLLYVVIVLSVTAGIGSFLMILIAPKFQQLLQDSGVEPTIFPAVVQGAEFVADYWWLMAGAVLLLAWVLRTERPGRFLQRCFTRPWYDMGSADVLQNLSVATEAGRPITGALSTLARYHHDPTLRQTLLFVRNEVEHGADLWDTLRRTKLLTGAEVALMEASEKVGNQAWAMVQLATSKRSRMRRRLGFVGQLAHPLAILVLGGIVLTWTVGFFSPLVELLWNQI